MRVPKIATYRKKDVRSLLRICLATYFKWSKRALITLWEKGLTRREQQANRSLEHNRQGFNRFDTPLAGFLYKKIKTGSPLSSTQKERLLKMMPRYTDQLYRLSDRERLKQLCDIYYGEA